MIKLINILNEIKVNNPAGEFCFADNGGETYYLDLKLRQYKESPSSQEEGDEHLHFNFPISGEGYDNIKDFDGEKDPLGLVKVIELHQSWGDFDPDFDIIFFKAFITNLVQAKIPIDELYFFTDGGWHYIDLTLSYKNIQKYIIPFNAAPEWFINND